MSCRQELHFQELQEQAHRRAQQPTPTAQVEHHQIHLPLDANGTAARFAAGILSLLTPNALPTGVRATAAHRGSPKRDKS